MDELTKTFDYKEKPEVFKYYPQYYHKTDKVCYFDAAAVEIQTTYQIVFYKPHTSFAYASVLIA